MVTVADIVQRQYPVIAPKVHALLAQVQQEQQQQQQHAGSFTENPAAVRLLRALRCLQLWETKQASQPEMPTLLSLRLAGVGSSGTSSSGACSSDGGGNATSTDGDVTEVIDLTCDSDGQEAGAACDAAAGKAEKQRMQAFLAGQVEVLLVREQQQQGGQTDGTMLAVATRVKPEGRD
jgi:hypothetical protein